MIGSNKNMIMMSNQQQNPMANDQMMNQRIFNNVQQNKGRALQLQQQLNNQYYQQQQQQQLYAPIPGGQAFAQ